MCGGAVRRNGGQEVGTVMRVCVCVAIVLIYLRLHVHASNILDLHTRKQTHETHTY